VTQTRSRVRRAVLEAVPRGAALPQRAWLARHRGIVVLLWVHVGALALVGAATEEPLAVWVLAPVVVAALTIAAGRTRLGQTTRALLATMGLLASSAFLVEFFDGLIEAHFHFFFTVAVVSLYQCWTPYFLAVGFVLVHHLAYGTLLPGHAYNHAVAIDNPWLFAFIHGGAVLAESVACLVFWKVTEEALDAERSTHEALKRTNDELSRANVAVADLVAMLAHDLRTPLVSIIGYSEMALEGWPEMNAREQMGSVSKINAAGHRLHAMLDDALTVSVLDGGGVRPRPVPVRVDEAVREVLATLPGDLPVVHLDELRAATACVDVGHLHQALTNVLTNAVKYGGGPFEVRCEEDPDHVVVRVVDSGHGVAASFVPHLFERFSRAEEARTGDQKGTGLGLYITRSLLLANDGDITYEPTPGGGSTFRLALPRAVGAAVGTQSAVRAL
jgi:signal transduction histidine kinase